MSPPAISVLMSVYNGERFLAEAVESILNQTFRDFEFIIVDDGSKDKTAGILADYAKRDARVRVIPQENTGRSEALNNGMKVARAPLIARMDADDISLPGRFEEQMRFLSDHPDVGLLGGQAERMGPKGESLGPYWPLPTQDVELRDLMLRFSAFVHPAVMMKRDLVLELGGFRKALPEAEDYDLFLRISERARVANLPQQVLRYRMHLNQASLHNMRLQTQCCVAAKAAAARRKHGLSDPLAEAKEFNVELLQRLGITDAEMQREELQFCANWIPVLRSSDAESALRVTETLIELCDSKPGGSGMAANALMEAASICYRQGRLMAALRYAARGFSAKPEVVRQHVRMALARRARGIWRRAGKPAAGRPA